MWFAQTFSGKREPFWFAQTFSRRRKLLWFAQTFHLMREPLRPAPTPASLNICCGGKSRAKGLLPALGEAECNFPSGEVELSGSFSLVVQDNHTVLKMQNEHLFS